MNKKKLTATEKVLVVFLIVMVIGASWYLFFYKNITAEISSINEQASEVDSKISVASAKLAKMNSMQAELDEIFAENENPSQIAPYDNTQNVLNQLNAILSTSKNYSLSISNPTSPDSNGIYRRTVSMSFSADSYEGAKEILMNLEQNHWRCIVSTVSFSGGTNGSLLEGAVSISASITFFESANVTAD